MWSVIQLLSIKWAGVETIHVAICADTDLYLPERGRDGWQKELSQRRNIVVGHI